MSIDLSSLRKAIDALGRTIAVAQDAGVLAGQPEDLRRAVRAGVIQHFEFTYELGWKFMKRRLAADLGPSQVDGIARQELFRLAAEHRLIGEVIAWMDFHQARNRTSHTYDEAAAEEVYAAALAFLPQAQRLLGALERFDD